MANQKDISSIKNNIPISEKYMLTIYEASAYFNIGVKKLRRMAENNKGKFAFYMGNRYLIVRTKFENYIEQLIMDEFDVNEDGELIYTDNSAYNFVVDNDGNLNWEVA